ncbi:MAG TPA: DUF72 domain-containing protein [Mycobacteriales bacterium]|nr:DUF72 domain-containing protein [Mycobacteriales bacterium]
MTIRVGTSGWQYADWRGLFYPDRLPQREWLSWYAAAFDSVEVNATFYRLPKREAVQRWADTLPDGFLMTVKASRYLTHIKRLRDPEEPVQRLLDRIEPLRERALLGPVLLQLPPAFPVDCPRLEQTLACLNGHVPVAVELRDPSWFHADVRDVLAAFDAPLVWADRDGRATGPLWETASWRYLRLHHGRDSWSYDTSTLRRWARRLSAHDGFAYANNDPGGAAVEDARRLRELLADLP